MKTTLEAHAHRTEDEISLLEEALVDEEFRVCRASIQTRGSNAIEPSAGRTRREIIGLYREGIRIASSVEHCKLKPVLLSSIRSVPSTLKSAVEDDCLHLFSFVFSLQLPEDVTPSEAEFATSFSQAKGPRFTPSVISFFPPETRTERLKAEISASVGLTGALAFAMPEVIAQLGGIPKGSVDAGIDTKFVLGPFQYALRKAEILASGLNEPRVQWKYLMDTSLSASSEFQSWVVLRTPPNIRTVRIDAELGVLPFKREWLVFKSYLPILRDRLKIDVNI